MPPPTTGRPIIVPGVALVLDEERVGNLLELGRAHFGKVVEVDDRPTARLTAAQDVTARGLLVSRAVETVAEVDGVAGGTTVVVLALLACATIPAAAAPEGRQDLAGGCRLAVGQAGHEV